MTDPQFNNPEIELGTKSKILSGSKNSKIGSEVQNGVCEGFVKDKITFKNVATPSATTLA